MPFASLTEHDQKNLHLVLNRIKERGAGILYVSHNFNEIRQFGNQVSVLNKGKLSCTLDLKQHSDEDTIKLMSGSAIKNRYFRLKVKHGKEMLNVQQHCASPLLKDINFSLHKGESLVSPD